MAHEFEKCGNCGAPLTGSADGRTVACAYCGASERRQVDPGLLLAALAAEGRTTDQLLDGLARRLAEAFPDLCRLEWSGGFLSARRVTAFELSTRDERFRLARAAHGVEAQRAEVVRGIVLKTQGLSVDDWLSALSGALARLAAEDARAREALRRVTAGG